MTKKLLTSHSGRPAGAKSDKRFDGFSPPSKGEVGSLENKIWNAILDMAQEGLMKIEGDKISLTEKGRERAEMANALRSGKLRVVIEEDEDGTKCGKV